MPTWNPAQYLQFNEQRSRPGRDLAQRVEIAEPKRVIDLGCGPGNSTAILRRRWPRAKIVGFDSSADMIAAARKEFPDGDWRVGEIGVWAGDAGETFDVVFSNAAMQWVDDHAAVLPKLFSRVSPGGALAIQVPANIDAPAHTIMRSLAAAPAWRNHFGEKPVREWHVHEPPFYYDALCSAATSIDAWVTEYLHILPDAQAIVEWYKGTGLRPFLDALPSDAERNRFAAEYLDEICDAYPCQCDGRVLFPFRRLFLIAYR